MGNGSIYYIRNTVNDKVYIGKTVRDPRTRFSAHKTKLRHNKHHSPELQQDWNIYGEAAFEFSILAKTNSSPRLNQLERDFMLQYKSCILGYNCVLPPHNPHLKP